MCAMRSPGVRVILVHVAMLARSVIADGPGTGRMRTCLRESIEDGS